MASHWTYRTFEESADLEQGDFLVPTAELKDVLRDVHPHFRDDKYIGFAVTTQSCDLVRRGAKGADARYVSIASVRPLKQVLPGLLAQIAPPIVAGIFPQSARSSARQFLSRLFNQNEQKLGLFYLHPDEALGIAEPAVVFLRVAVALRTEHYATLVAARRCRLAHDFQAKFGWLVGNLYSRAASRDWSEVPGGTRALDELIDRSLEEQVAGLGPVWVNDDAATAAVQAGVELGTLSRDALQQTIAAHHPPAKIIQVAELVAEEAARLLPEEPEKIHKLKKRLANHGALKQLIRS